ncbi:MAG: bifunctional 5,10-methylenetetrahydrofolate dehydrogenase/5,10-methenyltetrahydrofolate cyclohydrolase [Actinobacteria bacterium]|nr:bifunctional 5,10-methylenetetrahydrofolate dehydrogenase/5,10-methenyltetrahydrofolate cyclohydrolase [Actinomycetota bacterium]
MSAIVLPGAPVAAAVFADLKPRIDKLIEAGHTPGLATILVGDNAASAGYIRMKMAKAAELGMTSPHLHLPPDTTQDELIMSVKLFSEDPAIDGMLIQHPIPGHLDYEAALAEVDPRKDVDGAHPVNMGRLALQMPGPLPCTPAGIEALLAHYDIRVAGRHVVIVGRGFTLGRPLSLLMSAKRPHTNAAVTTVHTGVPNMYDYTRQADILIAAAGVPGIIQPEHVKPGAVVIGAGVSYTGKNTIVPDVAEECEAVAGWITPRVGGVGPTTIAMLFRNCIEAAERRVGWRD